MLFGFTFALVFIVCLLLSFRRVGSDDIDVGHGQNRLLKKDSTTKACLLLDHTYPRVYKITLSSIVTISMLF